MYGRNRNQFLIKEGHLLVGTIASPENITPDTDPMASLDVLDVGYFQQGTLNPEINREYAEFLAGTPAQLARKDLIRKTFTISAQLAQYNVDLMRLVQGLEVQTGTYDIAWIGPDEVTQLEYAYVIQTFLVDGSEFNIIMFAGKQTGEAVGPKLPGNAHSTFDFKVEAFPHSGFSGVNADQRSYGLFNFDTAESV